MLEIHLHDNGGSCDNSYEDEATELDGAAVFSVGIVVMFNLLSK